MKEKNLIDFWSVDAQDAEIKYQKYIKDCRYTIWISGQPVACQSYEHASGSLKMTYVLLNWNGTFHVYTWMQVLGISSTPVLIFPLDVEQPIAREPVKTTVR